MNGHTSPAEFDVYADDYEAALQEGIRLSGEDSEYFARMRVAWVARRVREYGAEPSVVMDFGCGTGSATPHLRDLAGVREVIGTDVSEGLLRTARQRHAGEGIRFSAQAEVVDGSVDLAFCNGVFHHIPPHQRAAAVEQVWRALRPGGFFAFWENNPWNPGTRMVMHRIPFDRDAVTLTASEARRALASGGFEVLRTDFVFIFPSPLRLFRRLEPALARWPLGAQYLVLVRRAEQSGGA